MGGKYEREPPATMKPEAELTEADKAELRDLKIGEGPFNRIITENIAFALSDGWTHKKTDEKHHIVWEVKNSTHCNKQAMRFTTKIADCNTATLEHMVVDEKDFADDPAVSYVYKYDRLITENHLSKMIGRNVVVQRNNFRSPLAMVVSPRQFVQYLTLGALLDPKQQEQLGLRPAAFKDADALPSESRTDGLMAFVQCGIEYTGNGASLKKGHERGHIYYYCVMAQEEPDNSITFTMTMDMDPAGKVPTRIVNMASDEQLKKMELMVHLLKKIGVQKHICDVYQNTRDFPCRNDL